VDGWNSVFGCKRSKVYVEGGGGGGELGTGEYNPNSLMVRRLRRRQRRRRKKRYDSRERSAAQKEEERDTQREMGTERERRREKRKRDGNVTRGVSCVYVPVVCVSFSPIVV
jgi:hypothetical protein